MRGMIWAAALALGVATFPAAVSAASHEEGKASKPLEGRLIDLSCYAMGMGGSDEHAKCALNCAEKGLPIGLLDEKTEKVYTLLLPSPKMGAYMEKTVRINGKVISGSLLKAEKMEVKEGEKWKKVELPKAM